MTTYRLRIRPSSPWATPWHADTLFGCLCWQWREMAGEAALIAWLQRFANRQPVFVLSNAFPGSCFPAPAGLLLEGIPAGKAKPPEWLTETQFRSILRNPTQRLLVTSEQPPKFRRFGRLQASIGRISGATSEDGKLFQITQQHFAIDNGEAADNFLSVYLRTDEPVEALVECFRMLSTKGFGKKSSTGLGAFEIEGPAEKCAWLDDSDGATGYVALSHFVPRHEDPTDGRWGVFLKYPKFHGNAVDHPFKGILLTLTPGSVFHTGTPPKPFYGRMVGIPCEEYPNALHYGLCLTAPAVVPHESA